MSDVIELKPARRNRSGKQVNNPTQRFNSQKKHQVERLSIELGDPYANIEDQRLIAL
jgi:hypothetical protein